MDTLDARQRSARMALVRAKDTKPELQVRRLVHGLGYRYQLHRSDLPGTPDLVFPARGKVILVHGCFWRRHEGCSLARLPKSRRNFWLPKLESNAERDSRNIRALRCLGWGVMTIWECQLGNTVRLTKRIRRFLDA
ncbi:MAG: DNA mismatch endonuclease Vsr [Betaproteobacteria bacterium]|nr:DNA mismatch endonuclease Vsr [Betaproteobacteria bacterium]